jgi:hypothetical protein
MVVNASGYVPAHFSLQRWVPVRWVIEGEEITNCNRRIVVPKLGLEFDVKLGEQTLDFLPRDAGVIPWSCWMGMILGQFDVIAIAPSPPAADAPVAATSRDAESPAEAKTVVAARPGAAPGETRPPTCAPRGCGTEPFHYTIARGDSLSGIAARFYGDAGRWRSIANANPGLDIKRLKPGKIIDLPP